MASSKIRPREEYGRLLRRVPRYIIQLDIQDPMDKLVLKFVGGLHGNIRHELEMFPLPSLQEAFRVTSKIEARRKASTKEE